MDRPSPASTALAQLLRWEAAGGTWEVAADDGTTVQVALLRCDGGELVDTLRSDDPELRRHVLG